MIFKYTKFNPTPYEIHMMVLDEVKDGSRVLDVGCATGYMARELKKKNCKIWGIEKDKTAAEEARKHCEEVLVEDIESAKSVNLKKNFFDYILLLDVIEHMIAPEKAIMLLKPFLRSGKIIISTPNIAHISVRMKLLFGNFNYEKMGIMDETHLRFYTKKTLLEFIKDTGLRFEKMDYPADFGQLPIIGKIARKISKKIQYKLTKLSPNLLSAQFMAVCFL